MIMKTHTLLHVNLSFNRLNVKPSACVS